MYGAEKQSEKDTNHENVCDNDFCYSKLTL